MSSSAVSSTANITDGPVAAARRGPDLSETRPYVSSADLGPIRPSSRTDVLRSEWTKMRTVRSTRFTVLIALVLTIGLAALIGAAISSNYSTMSPGERAAFDPTGASLQGLLFGQLAIGVLGVMAMTSEYATGMIRTSLSAVPKRGRFLAAKVVVLGVVALVVGEITSFVSFFVGQALLSGGAPHTGIGAHDVLRAVIGGGLYLTLIALIGLGLGALLRHTAGAITTLVALVFVLPAVLGALPSSWRDVLSKYWPTSAGSQIFTVHRDAHTLSSWLGFGELAIFTVVLLGIAGYALHRRDA